jgi:hypothetical protein
MVVICSFFVATLLTINATTKVNSGLNPVSLSMHIPICIYYQLSYYHIIYIILAECIYPILDRVNVRATTLNHIDDTDETYSY